MKKIFVWMAVPLPKQTAQMYKNPLITAYEKLYEKMNKLKID